MRSPALLDRYGLTSRDLEQAIGRALGRQVDYVDLYMEHRLSDALSLEEGRVKQASRNLSQGVGIRAVAGDKTGHAYSNEVTVERLESAAQTARCIAQDGNGRAVPVGAIAARSDLYPISVSPTDVPVERKIDLLAQVDRAARAYDPRIRKVHASLVCEHKSILVATSDGTLASDVQPLVRLHVTCIAEENGNRQTGSFGGGGRGDLARLLDPDTVARYAREAARQAIVNLGAIEAPAGTMTVVLGSGWPGILLHEAIGHGLEGDFNRRRTSAFTDMIGRRVASDLCTIVDDGTLPGRRGSLNVDDEGTPTQRTVLIERGILRGYLQDRLNARLMGMQPTGNGRRQGFAHVPMPRMTNTFMLAGESTPEEVIRSVDRGLYAVSFGGGQVDITSGKFVFSASEAYLIENGRVTRPVRGASLIGNGPEVLTRVSMVASDLRLDEGIGTCGKDGQSVPVGVGLPTIRIDGITVGGTQT